MDLKKELYIKYVLLLLIAIVMLTGIYFNIGERDQAEIVQGGALVVEGGIVEKEHGSLRMNCTLTYPSGQSASGDIIELSIDPRTKECEIIEVVEE